MLLGELKWPNFRELKTPVQICRFLGPWNGARVQPPSYPCIVKLPRTQSILNFKREYQDSSTNIYGTSPVCKTTVSAVNTETDKRSKAGNGIQFDLSSLNLCLKFTGKYHYREVTLTQILTLCPLLQKPEWFCGLFLHHASHKTYPQRMRKKILSVCRYRICTPPF